MHDLCYEAISGGVNYFDCTEGDKATCDVDLISCLVDLADDSSNWTNSPIDAESAEDYAQRAAAAFEVCIDLLNL